MELRKPSIIELRGKEKGRYVMTLGETGEGD
jgi:hypothetical protein